MGAGDGQGEHMGGDDVGLRGIEREARPGIFQGDERVVKGVVHMGMGGLVLPVVEVEVVEQAAPGCRAHIQPQNAAEAEAEIGHQQAVVKAAESLGVLGKPAHGAHIRMGQKILHKGKIFVLVFEIPHRADSFLWLQIQDTRER